jgi:hypothetical protein
MTMHDESLDRSFDELVREARRGYNAPAEPPLDRMWAEVEARHFGGGTSAAGRASPAPHRRRRPGGISWRAAIAGIAAALIVGVAVGRVSVRLDGAARDAQIAGRAGDREGATRVGVGEPYSEATTQYLGRTAALLSTLPVDSRGGTAGERASDQRFIGQATDLLSVTRLLLDSPAASDPRLKSLLEDLELVLAQIARLPTRGDSAELDLIRMAVEQRDVVPRLRSVAADIAANAGN